MRLWRFTDPHMHEYARASRRGTWAGQPQRRVRPLVIEWEPDSDNIADFTWVGFDSDIVVTDRVGQALQSAAVSGFELSEVQMVANSEAAKRRTRKPVVSLPYVGPKLWDLWVTGAGELDRGRSTVQSTKKSENGEEHLEPLGVERRKSVWDKDKRNLVTTHQTRMPGKGLFATTAAGIFHIPEFPAWIFCTDATKAFIESQKFTNVGFLEMGDVALLPGER